MIAIFLAMASACGKLSEAPANVTPKITAGDIPCGPNQVLETVCQQCHTSPPKNGAPFPLVTYSDIHSELDGQPIWFWMEKFVSAGDMPLPPVEITDQRRAILLEWLRAGAPSGEPSCVEDAGDAAR